MPAHDYDAIIVGAGPAGGHLGRILSEHGLHVLMLEELRVWLFFVVVFLFDLRCCGLGFGCELRFLVMIAD